MSFTLAKSMVQQTAGKHYPAPIAAVRTIEAAAGLGRDDALKLETAAFAAGASDVARALVGIFLNDQYVKGRRRNTAARPARQSRRRYWAQGSWAAGSRQSAGKACR